MRIDWRPWGDGKPHDGQHALWSQRHRLTDPTDPADTVLLACGPRWGKERCLVPMALDAALTLYAERLLDGSLLAPLVHVWVSAPTSNDFEQVWREFLSATRGLPRKSYDSRGSERLILFGDARNDREAIHIEFKSAWRPDSLVGVGLDIDYRTEWALYSEEADANLDDRGASPGRAGLRFLNGTPTKRPSARYRAAFREAQRGHPRYLFQNQPSWLNTQLGTAELGKLLEIRRNSSDTRWRANQGAELLQEGVGIPGFASCLIAEPEKPKHGYTYFITYDPAGKGSDWNWLSVWRWSSDKQDVLQQVMVYAYERMEWGAEKRWLRERMTEWPGEFHADVNGQLKLLDELRIIAPGRTTVYGKTWSGGEAKSNLVDAMVRNIGDHSILFLDPDKCGADERLEILARRQEAEFDEFDLTKLEARPGFHDDSVTCAWMACDLMGYSHSPYSELSRLGAL